MKQNALHLLLPHILFTESICRVVLCGILHQKLGVLVLEQNKVTGGLSASVIPDGAMFVTDLLFHDNSWFLSNEMLDLLASHDGRINTR